MTRKHTDISGNWEEDLTSPQPELATPTNEPCLKSVGVQAAPELHSVPYASMQDRRKHFYRHQITEQFSDAVSQVASFSSEEVVSFLRDVF